jgi:integrase
MSSRRKWPRQYVREYKSGRIGYQVDLRAVDNGIVTLPTQAESDELAHRARDLRDREGKLAFSIPPELRAEAIHCNERLAPHGVSLTDVTNYYFTHVIAFGEAKNVSEMVEHLLAELQRAKRSKKTLCELRSFYGRFAEQFGEMKIGDITIDELKEFCLVPGLAAVTHNNHIRMVGQLYNHAIKNKWASENLAKAITRSFVEQKVVPILTVEQARSMLLHAPEFGYLAYVALGLFAGIRSEELRRLDWSAVRIDEGFVVIGPEVAKIRCQRIIPINDTLKAWLTKCRRDSGPVVDLSNFAKFFRAFRAAAGVAKWHRNAMRRSFGSYHYLEYGNATATAELMGHTAGTDVFHKHYKTLTTPKAAKEFWTLRPDAVNAPAITAVTGSA